MQKCNGIKICKNVGLCRYSVASFCHLKLECFARAKESFSTIWYYSVVLYLLQQEICTESMIYIYYYIMK